MRPGLSRRPRGAPRSRARAALLASALVALASCARVHVTIETTVGSDGSLDRRVSFLRVKGPPLEEAYRLPSGPDWTVSREEVAFEGLSPEERRAVAPGPSALARALGAPPREPEASQPRTFQRYSARRHYPPGRALEADYVKPHPSAPGREALNALEVELAPGLLGTRILYRETFREASDPQAAVALIRDASRREVGRQMEAVRRAHPGAAPWGEVEARELAALERKLEEMFAAWHSIEDEASRTAAEEALGRYSDWAESLPERLSVAGGLELKEVEALLEDPEQEKREDALSDELARHLGAHIGEGDYSFTLIVHMPGAMVRTSSGEVRGLSTAICRFSDEYFLMRPFTCEAESWAPTGL